MTTKAAEATTEGEFLDYITETKNLVRLLAITTGTPAGNTFVKLHREYDKRSD